MTYDEMLRDLAAAKPAKLAMVTKGVSPTYTPAPAAAPEPLRSDLICISIGDIADAVDKAIVGECERRQIDEIVPLIDRLDELEGRIAALEAELAKFMPSRPRAVG